MVLTDRIVRHDDHDIRVGGEEVNEGREIRITNLHSLKLCLCLAAAQLELLDNVADLLEAVDIAVVCVSSV